MKKDKFSVQYKVQLTNRRRKLCEIDLLIFQDEIIYSLEFKKTAMPSKNIIRDFGVLTRLKKTIGQGGTICLSNTLLPIADKFSAIAVGLI